MAGLPTQPARNRAKRAQTDALGPWKAWRTRSRAARCIRFVETFCAAPKGHGAGRPLVLAKFQKQFLDEVLVDDVSAAAMRIPRGNGKSTLLAAVALWGLFDDDELGSPQIPIVASTLQQAKRSVYSVAASMVDKCDLLRGGRRCSRASVPSGSLRLLPAASCSRSRRTRNRRHHR